MKYRKISQLSYADEFQMGPFRVRQPLPSPQVEQVSPFILLHHSGPVTKENFTKRLDPHPHRGFEPVTFLFSGAILHKDSLGNTGVLKGGDVQWMTAGKGIIHSEGPLEGNTEPVELIQLWVNLPKAKKMIEPGYQDIPAAQIPKLNFGNGSLLELVAGEWNGMKGPAQIQSPLMAAKIDLKAGDEIILTNIPEEWNALVYILAGDLSDGDENLIHAKFMGVFNHESEQIKLKSDQGAKLLFLAGEPLREPLFQHGPFVMNTRQEIIEAIEDFQTGKMGFLDS